MSVLQFIEGYMNGNAWEELCVMCYRMRYQNEHYTPISAAQGGDGGIEGFTQNGIVHQCYCPEKAYSDEDNYTHMRDKMTKDIGKLLKPDYIKKLKEWGVPSIKEWHFVIPYYKDSRIIQHAASKKKEVINKKKDNPTLYDYIDDKFIIVIKQAEDFRFEITRTIRKSLTDTKLDLSGIEAKRPDWLNCDSEKVKNIKRKVEAVMGTIAVEEDFNEVVDLYIDSYIKGMEIMKTLRVSYAEIYEDVYRLEQAYKKQVKMKTMMNTDKTMNSDIFNEILKDFEQQLKDTCGYFSAASILELKTDIISMWLADCSMQFRK